MGNVTKTARSQEVRQQAALLLNFCRSVLLPGDDQLQAAMAEYEEMLYAEQERKAA